MLAGDLGERRATTICGLYLMVKIGEHLGQRFAHKLFVVDYQDRTGSCGRGHFEFARRRRLLVSHREVDVESGPFAWLRFNANRSLVALNDSVTYRQT